MYCMYCIDYALLVVLVIAVLSDTLFMYFSSLHRRDLCQFHCSLAIFSICCGGITDGLNVCGDGSLHCRLHPLLQEGVRGEEDKGLSAVLPSDT